MYLFYNRAARPRANSAGWLNAAALIFAAVIAAFCAGCKSKPPPVAAAAGPPKSPEASLRFDLIEASSPSMINLDFILETKNFRPEGAELVIMEWSAALNGVEAKEGLTFLPGEPGFAAAAGTEPQITEIPVRIKLDLSALPPDFLKEDDLRLEPELVLVVTYGPGDSSRFRVKTKAQFPVIREPSFSIVDIAVLKAELINTRFRVTLKVDNPNPFPVELSSFSYELYGGGRFWADGEEKNILVIPGRKARDAQLFLVMNFINMKRPLLDQIINLENVRYRFNGDVTVSTGVDYLPRFASRFDLSGLSRVYER